MVKRDLILRLAVFIIITTLSMYLILSEPLDTTPSSVSHIFNPGDGYNLPNYTKSGLNATIQFNLTMAVWPNWTTYNNITEITFEMPPNVIFSDVLNASNGTTLDDTLSNDWWCQSSTAGGDYYLNWSCYNGSESQLGSNDAISIWFNFTANSTGTEEPIIWTVVIVGNSSDQDSNITYYSTNIDDLPPRISLVTPVDYNNDTDGSVTFYYNTTDVNLDTCELWGNWSGGWHLNETFVNPTGGGFNWSSSVTLEDGSYLWTVYCNDTLANSNTTVENYTLTVNTGDTTPPNIAFIADIIEYEDFIQLWLDLTANFTDNLNLPSQMGISYEVNNSNVTLTMDNATTLLRIRSVANATDTANITLTGVNSRGLTCITSFDLIIIPLNDDPWVDIISPFNRSTNTTSNDIDFVYIPNDVEESISNCTLIVNDAENLTSTSITVNSATNLTIPLTDGNYSWNINCTDSENSIAASEMRRLYIIMPGENQTVATGQNVTVDENVTKIIVPVDSSLDNVTINSSIESSKDIELDFSQCLDSNNVTVGNNLTITRETTGENYSLELLQETIISGGDIWAGNMTLPTIQQTSSYSITNGALAVVISLGSSDELNLSKPAKVILGGQAAKRAAWASSNTTLTDISTVCDDENLPTNINTNSPRECYIGSGSDLVIWTHHFTIFAAYTPTSTPPSSSGSSGSGSSSLGVGTGGGVSESVSIATGGSAGETKTLTFSKDISITEVGITLQNTVNKISVTVEKLNSKPAEVAIPSGTAYSYLKIDKNLKDEDVKNAKIKFKVEKSWLTNKGFLAEDIILKRYTNKWSNLPTKKIKDDTTYVYYEAQTESFSYFTITAEKKPVLEAEPVEEEQQHEQEERPTEEKTAQPKRSWWGKDLRKRILYAAIIVLAGLLIIFFIKKFKLPEKETPPKTLPRLEELSKNIEIKEFCKQKLKQGYSKEDLINAAKKSGISEERIKKIIEKL